MAIDIHAFRFLDYVHRVNGPLGSTLTVGHQRLNLPARALRRQLGVPFLPGDSGSRYADDLLTERFGATTVASIDASGYEGATFVQDLNIPIEADFPKFDSVLDAGSLEHVFDVKTAFRNVIECCRVGGQILHISPANNYLGHGFYQFSPELFFSIYSQARGFDQTEVFLADLGRPNVWWRVLPPAGSRSTAVSPRQSYALVRARKIAEVPGELPVQQSDYVSAWQSKGAGNEVPSLSPGAARLADLSDRLPATARARLLQLMRSVRTGMNSRNPALTRVRPPIPPARPENWSIRQQWTKQRACLRGADSRE